MKTISMKGASRVVIWFKCVTLELYNSESRRSIIDIYLRLTMGDLDFSSSSSLVLVNDLSFLIAIVALARKRFSTNHHFLQWLLI